MIQLLITTGAVIVIIFIFMTSLYINAKVEIPDTCEDAYLEATGCGSCGNHSGDGHSCGYKDTLEFLKEVTLK